MVTFLDGQTRAGIALASPNRGVDSQLRDSSQLSHMATDAVKLGRGDFLGRDALELVQAEDLRRKLCALILDHPTAVAFGGEPILDGRHCLGRVTSGGFGYTVLQSIAYGYLPIDWATPGRTVQVELFGESYPARVVAEHLFDSANERVDGDLGLKYVFAVREPSSRTLMS